MKAVGTRQGRAKGCTLSLRNRNVQIAGNRTSNRLSGLDPNADYEIHAEFKGDVSPTRRLSSLDGRKDIYVNLIIARKK